MKNQTRLLSFQALVADGILCEMSIEQGLQRLLEKRLFFFGMFLSTKQTISKHDFSFISTEGSLVVLFLVVGKSLSIRIRKYQGIWGISSNAISFIEKFPHNSENHISKGQLVSKKIVKPRILPKNERLNSFLLVCDVFSFVFWKNP